MHPGPHDFVSLVGRCAIRDGRSDRTGVVLFCRARDILVVLAEWVKVELRLGRGAVEDGGGKGDPSEERGDASFHDTIAVVSNGRSTASQSNAVSTVSTETRRGSRTP